MGVPCQELTFKHTVPVVRCMHRLCCLLMMLLLLRLRPRPLHHRLPGRHRLRRLRQDPLHDRLPRRENLLTVLMRTRWGRP